MATALSETEFHRMQLQLIELRTTNYELEGKSKKVERELASSVEKIEALDRELAKAKQAISKSKKAKDVEILIQETNSLQLKLDSQEEEFRLQNQTLMTELGMLVADNEELKKEVESKKDFTPEGPEKSPQISSSSDELRRLQAENGALQKNLTALQEKFDTVFSKAGDIAKINDVSGHEDVKDKEEEDIGGDQQDVVDGPATRGGEVSTPTTLDHADALNKLRLEFDTELEEKKLLKEELAKIENESKDTIASLQEEIDKLTDKFKKKQESFLQLHEEKECVFKEGNAKLEESQASRDRDQKHYKDQIAKLQSEIEKSKKELEQNQSSSDKQADVFKHRADELHKQVEAANLVSNHKLQEQSEKHMAEMSVFRENISKISRERDDLKVQLQESQRVAQSSTSQLHEALAERDKQIAALQEVSKIAEKRKALVDEMAIKYQKEYDAHRENMADSEKKRAEETEKFEAILEEQKKKISELSRHGPVIEELTTKLHSVEDAKGWLERRLPEVEADLANAIKTHLKEVEGLKSQHQEETEVLVASHEAEKEQLMSENSNLADEAKEREGKLNEEIESLKNAATTLKQEVKDNVHEKKIHEKKGMTMLRDLKRQLHAERKRAEKLQIKLQEVLSDHQGRGVEELFRSPDSNDFLSGETSSVSSWGASASGLGKDSIASGPQSPLSGNNSFVSEVSVGDEYGDLLRRVAVIQQDKWALEEKVNHLEMSNACMAEDILNKTQIIEHYVMDSRSGPGRKHSTPSDDKISLKKVVEMVNKNSEHNQQTQDMNRKLQSMLEETLTKNMHLQKDLEFMSQEVVRLSKASIPLDAGASKPELKPPTSLPLKGTTTTPSAPLKSPTGGGGGDKSFVSDPPSSDGNFEMISSSEFDKKSSPLSGVGEEES